MKRPIISERMFLYWTDPASLPKPELHALPVPPLPKAINLITDAVCPLRESTIRGTVVSNFLGSLHPAVRLTKML